MQLFESHLQKAAEPFKDLDRDLILEDYLALVEAVMVSRGETGFNELFKKYLTNLENDKDGKKDVEEFGRDNPPQHWISSAFTWDATPENILMNDFWYLVSSTWEDLVVYFDSNGKLDKVKFFGKGIEEIQECTFCDGTGKREYTLFHHQGTVDGIEKCEICEGTGTIVYHIPY